MQEVDHSYLGPLPSKMGRPRAGMPSVLRYGGNLPRFELMQDAGVFGDTVLDAVHALSVAKLAKVVCGAPAGAIRKSLRTGLRTNVLRRGKPAHAAGFAAEKGRLDRVLYSFEHAVGCAMSFDRSHQRAQ